MTEYITLFVFYYVYSRWFLSLTLFLSWVVNKHRINLMNKFAVLAIDLWWWLRWAYAAK